MSDVKMPFTVFEALFRYIYADTNNVDDKKIITDWIETKVASRLKHDAYSDWKNNTLTLAEREQARQRYVDQAQISKDFR